MTSRARSRRPSIRFTGEWTNSFTGLTWRDYRSHDGRTVSICVQPFFARDRITNEEARIRAARKLRTRR